MQRKDISDEQVKAACLEYHAKDSSNGFDGEFVTDILVRMTGAPYKVAYAKLDHCNDRGLINYGVSLRTCWWEDDNSEAI